LRKVGLTTVESNAFRGIERYLGQLELSNNLLTDIPTDALQSLVLTDLIMTSNKISQISDYAFAGKRYGSVELSRNPLSALSNKSFANSTIYDLDLSYCQFEVVPADGLMPINDSLQNLYLSNNKITQVRSGTYSNLRRVQEPGLEGNPITFIEPGAFYGMTEVKALELEYLDVLTNVDVNIMNGVFDATNVQFSFDPMLQNITISDADKLPSQLKVIQFDQGTNIRYVDPNFEQWLNLSTTNMLYIDGNKNFVCTPDIAWMGYYIICEYQNQIHIDGTYCATTKQSLKAYIRTVYDVKSCP